MDLDFLKECLDKEVIKKEGAEFSWGRVIRRAWKHPRRRFLFWWRVASHLNHSKRKAFKILSRQINRSLIKKYNTEIPLTAEIQPGLSIIHYNGIVITKYCRIGRNFTIRQNTTIGLKNFEKTNTPPCIIIGNNVDLGANSCIIGQNIKIGDNVKIGAMSFIDKDISSNCTIYTQKHNIIVS